MINSDELGEKGESKFKELCADAGLICNKADRDRAGWDFIVDFNFDDQPSISLDHRKPPLSCHIQHKTILNTSKSVRMKLNMAERLAKELKPSFVCVFKVGNDLKFTDAFLIHISTGRLGAILKRLRNEQAKPDGNPLNKKFISFTPTEKERIDISGVSLKEALRKYCGYDIHYYSNEKHTQLERLGFDDKSHEGKFTIELPNHDNLADFFLGILEKVPVSNVETNEIRFGIPLPDMRLDKCNITIKPQSIDTCTLIFRGDGLDAPAVFTGEVFMTPYFLKPVRQFYIKSELFSIIIDINDSGTQIGFKFETQGKSCSPTIWADFWRVVSAFHQKTSTVEIKPNRFVQSIEMSIADGEMNMTSVGSMPSPEVSLIVCEGLSKIMKLAGIQPEPPLEFLEIVNSYNQIGILLQVINGVLPVMAAPEPPIKIIDEIPSGLHSFIFASHFQIGSVVITYYAISIIEIQSDAEFSSACIRKFEVKKIRCIDSDPATFEKFVEMAKIAEGIENVRYF